MIETPQLWVVVGAVAAVIAAVAGCTGGYISWRNRRDMDRYNLPVPQVLIRRHAPDWDYVLSFALADDSKWLVNSIEVHKTRPPGILSEAGEPVRDDTGVFQGFKRTGPWQKRISFKPPVGTGGALLHLDSPSQLDLRIVVSLISDSGFRKSLKIRCGILN